MTTGTAWHILIATCGFIFTSPVFGAGISSELKGHGGPVKAVAVDDAHGSALTGSFDYSLIYWRLPDRDNPPLILHRFTGHNGGVNAVAFVPGQPQALSASDDGIMRLFDLARYNVVKEFTGHSQKVVAVAVSQNGTLAVTASWDQTARVWDLRKLMPGPVLRGHKGQVNSVAFSHNQQMIFSAGYDGTIRAWHSASGQPIRSIYKHGWGINVIAPLRDGKRIAFGAVNGVAGVLDIASGKIQTLAARDRPILSMAYSATNQLIAIGGGDGIVEVFDLKTNGLIKKLHNPYGPIWGLSFSNNDTALYLAGLDDETHYWQFRPGARFEPTLGNSQRRFQRGDGLELGERQFARKCSVCHSLTRNDGNRAGPSLHQVFGRKAGSLPGYSYSPALLKSTVVWNSDTIDALFRDGPDHYLPGTKMPLQKMSNAQDRAALISYLKTHSQ